MARRGPRGNRGVNVNANSDNELSRLNEQLHSRIAELERQLGVVAADLPTDPQARGRHHSGEDGLLEGGARLHSLAALLEHSPQPFAFAYPDGRIGSVNDAFCELVGYSRDELRTVSWSVDLTPPEWRSQERELLAQLIRTHKPFRFEKEYIRRNGVRIPVEVFVHEA